LKRHKYALGLWKMLEHAIHDHYKKHYGLLPRRFEIHPANWTELRMDERMRGIVFEPDNPAFMGVPVVVDVKATRLKMITADNEVEYL
jgi:hypothetical protein